MSGECEKCHEHCLDCMCNWYETKNGKQQLLDIINEKFTFGKEGIIYCRECKNESIACVCMEQDNE